MVDLSQKDLLVFLGRVVNGVVDEVADNPFNCSGITADHTGSIRCEMEMIPHLFGNALIAVCNFCQPLGDVERGKLQLFRAAFQLGQIQHIVDQQGKSVGFLNDYLQMFGSFFRIVAGQVPNHFCIRFHHGQRCPHIMGHICN